MNPSSLLARKSIWLWSMLPPTVRWLSWPNSLSLLEACSEPPTVVVSVKVRSTVPHGLLAHWLPGPGGHGIGWVLGSRIWTLDLAGSGGGEPSSFWPSGL